MDTPAPRALRNLSGALLAAEEEKILRIVSMVDAMPARGAADDLLVPLRPRLAEIRPKRPGNLTRLLFTPLDPVILGPTQWRRGMPAVPRSVLTPLSQVVRAAVPDLAAALDGALAAAHAAEAARLAPVLWREAGRCLPDSAPPADWQAATGLNAADHAALTAAIGGALEQAEPMLQAVALAQQGQDVPEETLFGLLAGSGAGRPLVLDILLQRLPDPHRVMAVAGRMAADSESRVSLDRSVDHVLERVEERIFESASRTTPLRQAAMEAVSLARLVSAATPGPHLRARAEALRMELASLCRQCAAEGAARELLAPLAALREAPDDAGMEELEEAARSLRLLVRAMHGVGAAQAAAAALREAVTALGAAERLPAVDRARLVEIINGPDAGLAFYRTRTGTGGMGRG